MARGLYGLAGRGGLGFPYAPDGRTIFPNALVFGRRLPPWLVASVLPQNLPVATNVRRPLPSINILNVQAHGMEGSGAAQALSGYGRGVGIGATGLGTLFCSQYDDALSNLKLALTQAENASLQSTTAYQTAKAYSDDKSSFFGQELISLSCDGLVAEANAQINALNTVIAAAGGNTVTIPTASGGTTTVNNTVNPVAPPAPILPIPNPSDIMGTLKTVGIVAAIIAGAVVIAPIVYEAVAAHRLKRVATGR